jgi:hypothetical protein
MNFTVDSENIIETLKKEVEQLKADNTAQAIRIEKLVFELSEARAILIKQQLVKNGHYKGVKS